MTNIPNPISFSLPQYIIVRGNAVDGLTFTGPFESSHEAVEYASTHIHDDWTIAPIVIP